MRVLIVLSACLAVAGCERPVLSRRPLVPADVRSPPLKTGVWLYSPEEGCQIDVKAPAAQWPDCADWTLVAEGRIVRARVFKHRRSGRASVSYVLGGGDPRVMQEPDADQGGLYRYSAVRPLSSDEAGRIVEAEIWPVVCPPEPAKGQPALTVPGLRIGERACRTDDAAVLRRIVARGREWSFHRTMRWIRDGDR